MNKTLLNWLPWTSERIIKSGHFQPLIQYYEQNLLMNLIYGHKIFVDKIF